MCMSRFTEERISRILKERGWPVGNAAVPQAWISDATFYKWRSRCLDAFTRAGLGITGKDFPYKRVQVAEQVTKAVEIIARLIYLRPVSHGSLDEQLQIS